MQRQIIQHLGCAAAAEWCRYVKKEVRRPIVIGLEPDRHIALDREAAADVLFLV